MVETFKRALMALAVFCASSHVVHAAVSVTSAGFTYSQNFNSLATTGTNITWANDSTLVGWHLFTGAGNPISTYAASNGSDNTGSVYSFGTTASPDRALGTVASGAAYFGNPAVGNAAAYIAVNFTNNSGGGLSSIQFGFSGEQWRNSGDAATQGNIFQYGFGTTFAGVATWISPGGNLSWVGPIAGGAAANVDGNGAGLVANRGGTLTGLPWSNGSTLWLRWSHLNNTGFDHGLAMDDFQVTAVPEPAAFFIGALGMLRLLIRRR